MKKNFLLCFLLLIILFSCKEYKSKKKYNIDIKPCDIFQEDKSILKNHFGLIAHGCFLVKYQGAQSYLSWGYELWENGKIIKKTTWFSQKISQKNNSIKIGDFSLSVKRLNRINDEPLLETTLVTRTFNDNGINISSQNFHFKYDTKTDFNKIKLYNEQKIIFDYSIPFWVVYTYNKNKSFHKQELNEIKKNSQKVLLFYIKLSKFLGK